MLLARFDSLRVAGELYAETEEGVLFRGVAADTRAAATGNTLRVNFFRSQGSPPNRKAIVWQPTHRPTFHVPEVFGTLRLVD